MAIKSFGATLKGMFIEQPTNDALTRADNYRSGSTEPAQLGEPTADGLPPERTVPVSSLPSLSMLGLSGDGAIAFPNLAVRRLVDFDGLKDGLEVLSEVSVPDIYASFATVLGDLPDAAHAAANELEKAEKAVSFAESMLATLPDVLDKDSKRTTLRGILGNSRVSAADVINGIAHECELLEKYAKDVDYWTKETTNERNEAISKMEQIIDAYKKSLRANNDALVTVKRVIEDELQNLSVLRGFVE